VFQTTADRSNFQGRYILRHPWTGSEDCAAAKSYRAGLKDRRAQQAKNVAALTGWSLERIRQQMAVNADWSAPEDRIQWWQRIWKD